MIDPKELRLGNIVQHVNGDITSIFGIINDDEVSFEIMDTIYEGANELIEPIPITPEWLERFGFQKDDQPAWTKPPMNAIMDDGRIIFSPFHDAYNILGTGIYFKYIHQLQNLYFALTG